VAGDWPREGWNAPARDSDPSSIPACRVRQDQALVLADRAAAEKLGTSEKLEAQQ
jgi:hypothetical protein